MACLDPDSLQALVAGSLVGQAKAEAEAHLDACDECRQVVASLVRQSISLDPLAATPVSAGVASTIADRMTASSRTPRPARSHMVALAAGTKVGRYRVTATLGAGGMGVVYRAEDPELGRDIAIKLLRGDRSGPEEERRLVREGQALARVSHPNVIAVHDVGTTDGQVFVAMELVDGTSLRKWLSDRPRSVAEALAVIAAAGRGLAAAHAAGLIHRDFKPDNVLVGRDGRVRVTDFGLARRERAPGPVTSGEISLHGDQPVDMVLTRAGALIGSPAYMAPEQLAGDHVDARSDQFGFCVTLYEALYGQRPFGGQNLFELEDNVIKGKVLPPPPGRSVPGGLRAIALRGLSIRPGDRFPSMDHLLAALGRSRARGLRVLAAVAASLALAAGVGMFGNWLARDHQLVTARAGFRAATQQLDGSLTLTWNGFRTFSDASAAIPLVHDIMGNRDQADFGFGSVEEDRAHLQELHDGMVSADWLKIIGKSTGGVIALSDYKGRLIYTTAAPGRWGSDVQAVDAIQHAMTPGVVVAGALARGDDPAVLASGIIGHLAHPEWWLVFIRQFNAAQAVQGLFIQAIEASQLLEAIRASNALADETAVAIVAPSGEATDTMARDLVDAAVRAPGKIREVEHADQIWAVHAGEIGDLGEGDKKPVARIVIASPIHADGLFASARLLFAVAFAGLLAIAMAAMFLSRRSARLLGAIAATADSSAPVVSGTAGTVAS